MTQAEAHLTTRRGFSKWLAGLAGSIAMTPKVAVAAPQIDWDSYYTRTFDHLIEISEAKHLAKDARSAVRRWEKKNPYPDTVEGDAVWRPRYVQACKDSGIYRHNRALKSAREELFSVCEKIADEQAVTADDFSWKHYFERMTSHPAITSSIRRDIAKVVS